MRRLVDVKHVPGTLLEYRLYLLGARWHHGRTGLLLSLFRRTRKIGLALMVHDLGDFPWTRD